MCIFANCNLNGYMLQVADNNMVRRHRYFVHLAYNGAGYCGWQIQPNAPSVQETLEKAISTVLRMRIEVVVAAGLMRGCMRVIFMLILIRRWLLMLLC